jgi:hypothetical protein
MAGQVVSLPMGRGGGKVGVLGELMKFGSSLMRIIWHGVSCPRWPIHLEANHSWPLTMIKRYSNGGEASSRS